MKPQLTDSSPADYKQFISTRAEPVARFKNAWIGQMAWCSSIRRIVLDEHEIIIPAAQRSNNFGLQVMARLAVLLGIIVCSALVLALAL